MTALFVPALGSLRKAPPAITFYIDACFISGDGVRWGCHPCLDTVPNLIDFYTEVQLLMTQVAFMYLQDNFEEI